MKATTLIGILLIALGIGAIAYQGFSYKTREQILDIGPIQATSETTRTIPIPQIIGALALIGGVAIVVASARGTTAVV